MSATTTSAWREVTARDPCPACGKGDWCSRVDDDTWFQCHRLADAPPGYVLHHPVEDCGAGPAWVFVRADAKPNGTLPLDEKARGYAVKLTPRRRAALAEKWGVAPEALTAIGAGYDGHNYRFPERNAPGRVTGITYVAASGKRRCPKGQKRSLTIPRGLELRPDPILIVEGPSDVAAAETMGLPAVGRPSNRGGVAEAARLLRGHRVLVVGEYDEKEDGSFPGRDGAEYCAGGLAAAWGVDGVAWTMPPDEAKDTRAWLNAQNIDLADDQARANAGRRFLAALEASAEMVPPAETQDQDDRNIIEKPDPIPLAEHLIETHYRDHAGRLLLRRWRGDFYQFSGACWARASDEQIDAAIWTHLAHCWTPEPEGGLRPIVPRRSLVQEVRSALPSRGLLLNDALEAPAWLDGRDGPDPTALIPCANGLLDIGTRRLSPATPDLWITHTIPVAYNPDAPPPTAWLKFLNDLWPDDPKPKATLQECMAYQMTAHTEQQKATMLVGPKRSGKGTIARVITGLHGAENVAAPTLAGLGTNFGLQALLDKPLAIISDARLSGRSDQAVVVERLLRVTGEDALTVDRKHQAPITVSLPTRIMVLTNELPRLFDSSGAMANRFIVFVLTRSFFGHEDTTLTDRLLAELPSILNWMLDGWEPLTTRGHFVQPPAAVDAIRDLEELGSPVAAFIRQRCVRHPAAEIEQRELYNAWRGWCEQAGRRRPGDIQTFGRDLRAACPGLGTRQPRKGDERYRTYCGIALDPGPDEEMFGGST